MYFKHQSLVWYIIKGLEEIQEDNICLAIVIISFGEILLDINDFCFTLARSFPKLKSFYYSDNSNKQC